jgi:DNA-directed RNA polymerase subunit F
VNHGAAARDLARIDRQLSEIDRKRKNLTANLAELDPESAADVRDLLKQYAKDETAVDKNRTECDRQKAAD